MNARASRGAGFSRSRGGRSLASFAIAVMVAGLSACGGGGKPANSPENASASSPDGGAPDMKSGEDGAEIKHDDSTNAAKASFDDSSHTPAAATGGAAAASTAGGEATGSSGAKTLYDKDAVGVEVKRAVRQVKGNCGAATDENGEANGPWGKLTANVTLGRNGHIRQVQVPPEYNGKPVGDCIVQAFQRILFPPYAASSDATIDVDIEVTKPVTKPKK